MDDHAKQAAEAYGKMLEKHPDSWMHPGRILGFRELLLTTPNIRNSS